MYDSLIGIRDCSSFFSPLSEELPIHGQKEPKEELLGSPGSFALCGVRPETLSLDSATFLEKRSIKN
jgi:hypothetical protein